MTWLVWRQHRSQLYFAIGALAALTVLLLVTGLQMASSTIRRSLRALRAIAAATWRTHCSWAVTRWAS